VLGDRDLGKLVLGSWVLGGPTPPALAGEDLAVQEQLAAPHTPRLPSFERPFEAGDERRAGRTDVLGPGDVLQLLAEEQLGETSAAVVAAGVRPPAVLDEELGPWLVGVTLEAG
jgi:hypothetical protein